jgi:hypothetical protein
MFFRIYPLILLFTTALSGCGTLGSHDRAEALINGANGLENFTRVGEANWKATDGAIQASQSSSTYAYLVTKSQYKNFRMKVEFWASDDANSGVFMRCQDPRNITAENCYEANIFDQRPDPSYGTGAIVLLAKAPEPMPKAGGRWNTYEITADGSRLTLVLNGITTVDITDDKLADGHIALQWGAGTVKFRKLVIQPL